MRSRVLEPILVVGLNRMFTGATIWVLTHGQTSVRWKLQRNHHFRVSLAFDPWPFQAGRERGGRAEACAAADGAGQHGAPQRGQCRGDRGWEFQPNLGRVPLCCRRLTDLCPCSSGSSRCRSQHCLLVNSGLSSCMLPANSHGALC